MPPLPCAYAAVTTPRTDDDHRQASLAAGCRRRPATRRLDLGDPGDPAGRWPRPAGSQARALGRTPASTRKRRPAPVAAMPRRSRPMRGGRSARSRRRRGWNRRATGPEPRPGKRQPTVAMGDRPRRNALAAGGAVPPPPGWPGSPRRLNRVGNARPRRALTARTTRRPADGTGPARVPPESGTLLRVAPDARPFRRASLVPCLLLVLVACGRAAHPVRRGRRTREWPVPVTSRSGARAGLDRCAARARHRACARTVTVTAKGQRDRAAGPLRRRAAIARRAPLVTLSGQQQQVLLASAEGGAEGGRAVVPAAGQRGSNWSRQFAGCAASDPRCRPRPGRAGPREPRRPGDPRAVRRRARHPPGEPGRAGDAGARRSPPSTTSPACTWISRCRNRPRRRRARQAVSGTVAAIPGNASTARSRPCPPAPMPGRAAHGARRLRQRRRPAEAGHAGGKCRWCAPPARRWWCRNRHVQQVGTETFVWRVKPDGSVEKADVEIGGASPERAC